MARDPPSTTLSLTQPPDTAAASSARWSWLPIIRVTFAGSPRCRYLAAAMRPASVRERRNASPPRNRARAIAASARVARGAEGLGGRLGIGDAASRYEVSRVSSTAGACTVHSPRARRATLRGSSVHEALATPSRVREKQGLTHPERQRSPSPSRAPREALLAPC